MKNLPIPLLTFLAAQIGGAVWFAAQLESRVYTLETEDYTSQHWCENGDPDLCDC